MESNPPLHLPTQQQLQQQPHTTVAIAQDVVALDDAPSEQNNIEIINRWEGMWERLEPEKTVEVEWKVKRKKNGWLVIRRIKRKTWHHRYVLYERHPARPDSSTLKKTRTLRHIITRRDTVRRLSPAEAVQFDQQKGIF